MEHKGGSMTTQPPNDQPNAPTKKRRVASLKSRLEHAVAEIARLQRELDAAKGQWIPVAERLPEPDKPVLGWSAFDGIALVVRWRHVEGLSEFNGHWQEWMSPDSHFAKSMRYWMPLPNGPKE